MLIKKTKKNLYDWGKSQSKFTNLPYLMMLSMTDLGSQVVVAACLSCVDRLMN